MIGALPAQDTVDARKTSRGGSLYVDACKLLPTMSMMRMVMRMPLEGLGFNHNSDTDLIMLKAVPRSELTE